MKNYLGELVKHIIGLGGNNQLLNRLKTDLDNLKNDNLKKNFKKISKSRIDILDTQEKHSEIFLHALELAEENLVILSNWGSDLVTNEDFESSLRSCLTRGVNIHIGYIDNHSDISKNPKKEFKTKKNAKIKIMALQEWCFKELGQGCRLYEISDLKLTATLILDDKYIIIGDSKQEKISWVFYDKNFVISERDAIIGNFDGPIELTRRGLFKKVIPGTFNE
tara:strand:- start:277 stop:942 length:666 start_codon:yes stop_codon:yes gene_type:complete